MRLVPLYGRDGVVAHALVDSADFDLVSRYRWNRDPYGYAMRHVPVREAGRKTTQKMHRLIMGLGSKREDPREVDHKDGDPLNNLRSNLRVCTHAQNHENRTADRNAVSPFRGVTYDRRQDRFFGRVHIAGRPHYVGSFKTEGEASDAVEEFRERHLTFSNPDRRKRAA